MPGELCCDGHKTNINMTSQQLNYVIKQIRSTLLLNKTHLDSYKRKLTSAADDRVSARAIGLTGVLVLLSLLSLVLIGDVQLLFNQLRTRHRCGQGSRNLILWFVYGSIIRMRTLLRRNGGQCVPTCIYAVLLINNLCIFPSPDGLKLDIFQCKYQFLIHWKCCFHAYTQCHPFLHRSVLRLIIDPSEYQSPYTAWNLGLRSTVSSSAVRCVQFSSLLIDNQISVHSFLTWFLVLHPCSKGPNTRRGTKMLEVISTMSKTCIWCCKILNNWWHWKVCFFANYTKLPNLLQSPSISFQAFIIF